MLNFQPLTSADIPVIIEWMKKDPLGHRFVSFYERPDEWLALIEQDAHRHGWLVLRGENPVGFCDLEEEGEVGWLTYYIAPQKRGSGLGAILLKEFEKIADLKELRASVEPDNLASVSNLKTAGYKPLKEEDGLSVFGKTILHG